MPSNPNFAMVRANVSLSIVWRNLTKAQSVFFGCVGVGWAFVGPVATSVPATVLAKNVRRLSMLLNTIGLTSWAFWLGDSERLSVFSLLLR
jgi:hypothetical protein